MSGLRYAELQVTSHFSFAGLGALDHDKIIVL
jgi:hypothetical protein